MQALLLVPLAGLFAAAAWANDGRSQLEIVTLSNRADLISGGDALVEVRVPKDVSPSRVKVKLNDRDITSSFTRNAAARTLRGLVTGLVEGRNDLVADPDGKGHGKEARLTITNHPIGGPVLSGPQITPYFCATPTFQPVNGLDPARNFSGLSTAAVDAQCNIATEYKLYYRTTATPCTFAIPDPTPNVTNFLATTAPAAPAPGTCFKPYDPSAPPPADLAKTTTDHGKVDVPYIVRVERGTMNRGIYDIAVLFNPAQPWDSGVVPQAQWNGKILYQFGAATGQPRRQARSTSVWTNDLALSRGYLVAQNSMTDSSLNSNRVSMSETVMMMKEHVGDRYGPVKFTMGTGCSGGSINSNMNASIMPGNLDGITISCAFPDSETTGIEVGECVLLAEAYNKPPWTALQAGLTQAQINLKKAAINGHPDQTGCHGWYNSFGSNAKVGNYLPRGVQNSATGVTGPIAAAVTNNCQLPLGAVYDPVANPTGPRCHAWDWAASIFGRTSNDLSANPTDLRARETRDNVGVQYGLKAMLSGAISAEEFVTLNEIVGGFDKDSNFQAARTVADREALEIAYRAGIVMSGRQYAKTPVIDLRGWDDAGTSPPLIPIHYQWRTFSIRERLDREFGDHDNQVIWRFSTGLLPPATGPGSELPAEAFLTMDKWLTALKADTSHHRIEQKVRKTKPAEAVDFCIVPTGREFDLAACESQVARYKVFSSPRQVAGGPLSENILKCRLKPLNSVDYAPVTFTPAQWTRLQAVFADGVCDWSERGVGQRRARSPRDYSDGPGGEPLPRAPQSHPGHGHDDDHDHGHGHGHDD
jgi:uncharacterized tannase-like protein DUF6351